MNDFSAVVLITGTKDGAEEALKKVRDLDRTGWIELIDYVVLSKDAKGNCRTEEAADDESWEMTVEASPVRTGTDGRTPGAAVQALVGAGSVVLSKLSPDEALQEVRESLGPNSSALSIIVEERYVDRLGKELENLGSTFHKPIPRAQRELAFAAYVDRQKVRIRSLMNEINEALIESKKVASTDRARIEAAIVAKRAQAAALRERLESHLRKVAIELKTDIRDFSRQLKYAGASTRNGLQKSIEGMRTELNDYFGELVRIIQNEIDALKQQADDLEAKASSATGETRKAIEDHLVFVQSVMNEAQTNLRRTFDEQALQVRQAIEDLKIDAASAGAELRKKLEESIKNAEVGYAKLTEDIREAQRNNKQAWNAIRGRVRKSWEALTHAFEEVQHHRDQL